MIKVRFICKNCGKRFTAEVFEKREAEEKKMHKSPVQCPQCRSVAVERD